MLLFTTYFDSAYLERGLALYHSLVDHCRSFKLYVLALDLDTELILSRLSLDNMVVVPLHVLTDYDNQLMSARQNRSLVEFYWTCSASWLLFLLKIVGVPQISYFDADLYCVGPIDEFYQELDQGNIAITPHRFPPELAWRERGNGTYNFGWAYFPNTPLSISCLEQWRLQCLAWCYHKYESDQRTTGEQGYMTNWPKKYNAIPVNHPGINLAPWNQMQYQFEMRNTQLVILPDNPVILYHTHEFVFLPESKYVFLGRYKLHPEIINHIYQPYIRLLANLTQGKE